MTDSLGRTDYEYDSLSRLKSETRQFTETLPNGAPLAMAYAPDSGNRFKLSYGYGLTNQLTSLTDPYGAVINYGYDRAGRLDNMTGTSFGGVTSYAKMRNTMRGADSRN
jgi:YD repeat-containing protein